MEFVDFIFRAESEYYGKRHFRPTKLLVHPAVRDKLIQEIRLGFGEFLRGDAVEAKPERLGNLEVVEVDPRTHGKDYWELVG